MRVTNKEKLRIWRALMKAQRMYADSLTDDETVLTHTHLPETFNHRRARFIKLRDYAKAAGVR